MNKEISVLINNGEVVVSSRQVAENFGKAHKNVIRDIENLIKEDGSILSIPLIIESTYQNEQNKQWYKEYLLTRDGFTLLAMGFTGAKALQWKLKYMDAFNKMESKLKELIQEPQYKLPTTFLEALRMLADTAEELEKSKEVIALVEAEVKEKEAKIEVLEPKAEYYDRVLQPEGLTSTTVIAKDYGMTGRKLNSILRKLRVQYKQGNVWVLYSKYQDKGYTDYFTGEDENTGRIYNYMKWTQIGRKFIYDLLVKEGYIN